MSIRVVILTFTSSPATATIRAPGTCRRTRLQSSVADRSPARGGRLVGAGEDRPGGTSAASGPGGTGCGRGSRRPASSSTITSVSALGITVSVAVRPPRQDGLDRALDHVERHQRAHRVVDDHDVVVVALERAQAVAGALVAGRSAGHDLHRHRERGRLDELARLVDPAGCDTTTTRSTDAPPSARSVRSRMGSPASRTNCLGISPPKRLPSPPARTMAWICTRRDYVSAASRAGTHRYHRFPT